MQMTAPPPVPAALQVALSCQDLHWSQVWRPLSRAMHTGLPVELDFDATHFAYDPQARVIHVADTGDEGDDAQMTLAPDDFLPALAAFFKGAPTC